MFQDGLLGHYTFDGSALDISGNGNNADLYNINYTEGHGSIGQAIEFDGTTSWGQISHSSSLAVNGEYSLSYWSKYDPVTNEAGDPAWIISKGDAGNNNEVYRYQKTLLLFQVQ